MLTSSALCHPFQTLFALIAQPLLAGEILLRSFVMAAELHVAVTCDSTAVTPGAVLCCGHCATAFGRAESRPANASDMYVIKPIRLLVRR